MGHEPFWIRIIWILIYPVIKVQILQEGHKIWKNLPLFLKILSNVKVEYFFQIFVAISDI